MIDATQEIIEHYESIIANMDSLIASVQELLDVYQQHRNYAVAMRDGLKQLPKETGGDNE